MLGCVGILKKVNLAIIGATGMVGSNFIKILQERNFPINNIYFFASARSASKAVHYNGQKHLIQELNENSFKDKDINIGLFSAGGGLSALYAPLLVEAGGVAIDNSSHFRMHNDVPLVVPEVNPDDINCHSGIIANPNCSTIQAVVALSPLHKAYGIKRVIYNTYQAVSGSGMAGVNDLQKGLATGAAPKNYPHPIANNVLPQVDVFEENGYTKEELKMINETRKILRCDDLKITATCVRVPVLNGHSESINVEFNNIFKMDDVIDILSKSPGVKLENDFSIGQYPMPISVDNTDHVYIGRIRRDQSAENCLNMWVVADNLRKGAATNAIQIAELLLDKL